MQGLLLWNWCEIVFVGVGQLVDELISLHLLLPIGLLKYVKNVRVLSITESDSIEFSLPFPLFLIFYSLSQSLELNFFIPGQKSFSIFFGQLLIVRQSQLMLFQWITSFFMFLLLAHFSWYFFESLRESFLLFFILQRLSLLFFQRWAIVVKRKVLSHSSPLLPFLTFLDCNSLPSLNHKITLIFWVAYESTRFSSNLSPCNFVLCSEINYSSCYLHYKCRTYKVFVEFSIATCASDPLGGSIRLGPLG